MDTELFCGSGAMSGARVCGVLCFSFLHVGRVRHGVRFDSEVLVRHAVSIQPSYHSALQDEGPLVDSFQTPQTHGPQGRFSKDAPSLFRLKIDQATRITP